MSTSSRPQINQMIPDFKLKSTDDREFRISIFRGHRDLVLVFTAGTVPQIVADIASRIGELDEENARAFVIAPAASRAILSAAHGIPVLLDPELAVSRRFGADREAAVYITDQYGEIYSAHSAPNLPTAHEVLASLRHINAACPE